MAANKADNQARELDAGEFFELGWEETYPISALHGRGVADLLDAVVWDLPPESAEEIARKEREREADDWAREEAAGRLAPIVVGEGDDERRGDDEDDASWPRPRPSARRWDALIAAESGGRRRRDRDRRPAERRQVVAAELAPRRGARDRQRRSRARRATRSTPPLAVGPLARSC